MQSSATCHPQHRLRSQGSRDRQTDRQKKLHYFMLLVSWLCQVCCCWLMIENSTIVTSYVHAVQTACSHKRTKISCWIKKDKRLKHFLQRKLKDSLLHALCAKIPHFVICIKMMKREDVVWWHGRRDHRSCDQQPSTATNWNQFLRTFCTVVSESDGIVFNIFFFYSVRV